MALIILDGDCTSLRSASVTLRGGYQRLRCFTRIRSQDLFSSWLVSFRPALFTLSWASATSLASPAFLS